jgi:hypothetical protein
MLEANSVANPHPWYGPCDAFAPQFQCSECWELRRLSLWFWAHDPAWEWYVPATDFVPAKSQKHYWSRDEFNAAARANEG